MALVSAEDRRTQARGVALQFLREGRSFEDLTLRDVAAELGIPLSTLTYAYPAVTDLLDDFNGFVDDHIMPRVGNAGLREELHRYVDQALDMVRSDPGTAEIWRYLLSRIGHGLLALNAPRQISFVTRVRELAGEDYRLSDELIGRLFRKLVLGATVDWLDVWDERAEREWVQSVLAGIEVIALAADPRPVGEAHAPTDFAISSP